MIKIDYLKAANYSLIRNGIAVLKSLDITNTTSSVLRNCRVTIEGEYLKQSISSIIESVAIHETVRIKDVDIIPDADQLICLTEGTKTTFKVSIMSEGTEIHNEEFPLDIMAYDQWLGTSILPQTLVSFVTPNHPAISSIITKAAVVLKELTGSSSFIGYQSGNTNDVRAQVGAIFTALHQHGIIYKGLPASYESYGQRITLPENVLDGKIGNCIELTLLFCSILESIGINSGIIICKGHAYLAVWLVDDCCNYSIIDDPSFIEKKCSNGIDEMMVLECTKVTSENAVFKDAIATAEHKLSDFSTFEIFIDVLRCRLEHFLPLPSRVQQDGKWTVEGVEHDSCITEIQKHDRYDLSKINATNHEVTKFDIWERKLLDFSLRNSLLNLNLGRRAIQIISFDIDKIEDKLSDGEEFCIISKPDNFSVEDNNTKVLVSKSAENIHELINKDINRHQLHSFLTESETKNALKNIYRGARNAIEETGANSLFLSVGTLRWLETLSSTNYRYAPLILIPVEMVYKKGNYFIRTRDEETIMNITLLEFLRQSYDIKINGIDPLPKDEHGIDVNLIFTLIRDALKDQKGWDVEEECILGTFSFSKFLMWNDIHNHRDEMLKNNVISSLVENRLTWTPAPISLNLKDIDRTLSPSEIAIPVPVDSSQLAAVIEGGKGNSFILYGPPGTGKSQTITNLIANALYQNKRVLFVAEKMAALSVVQSRLAKIGLDPFCLEIHSNKVTKKHILEQLSSALSVSHIASPAEFSDKAEKIFAQRKLLINNMTHLHDIAPEDGLSLYDCIVQYESIDAVILSLFSMNRELDFTLSKYGQDGIDESLNKLDTMLKLVGQPSTNPLRGLHLSADGFSPETLVGDLQKSKSFIEECRKNASTLALVSSLREKLLRNNTELLLQQDAKKLYDEWREAKAKWFFPRYFAKKNFINKLREYNQYLTENEVDTLLNDLLDYKSKHDIVEKLNGILRKYFTFMTQTDEMPSDSVLTKAVESITLWVNHKDKMRDWLHWCNFKIELFAKGLSCVYNTLEQEQWQADALHKSFLKTLYKEKALRKMVAIPQLASFEGMVFDETIKLYKQLAEEFQLLTQKELYSRLASRIPRVTDNINSSSEIGLLNRCISSGARGVSLRGLLDQIPSLLPRLCPCLLMSPMSVAQFLDLSQEKFDLVIFDEASQMPTSEAVGAIARGKSLIVVGDPKQMPPTSFFTSTNVDEEEAAIDDMESILEDCRTLNIPSLQLNWHYRSRHESLIAFSNNEYYEGSLITFPSVDDRVTKVGYVPVKGYYDKGGKRSNKAEAEAIVNEIVRRLRNPELTKKSIGVISFSVVQQSLIEDILQDRLDADKTLREAADNMYEPIFVKNLENVQGDERDVILFSIGYGPNKEDKVSMNFGPLNNIGGERRLNVAVSRARCEMIVFSTLKAAQIDLRRSKAKGVEGLKHFLEYAESQTLVKNSNNASLRSDTVIADNIASALNKHGYQASTSIGRSVFKVDIAVCSPSNPNEYLLGILLDGEGYRDTQTTRDREIVKPSVLSSLRWKVMRVWSVDWFNNPERVISRIIENIDSTPAPEPTPALLKFDISSEPELEAESNATEYVEYQKTSSSLSSAYIKEIVKTEQPILLSFLSKRVASVREISRVTAKLNREVLDYATQTLYVENDHSTQVIWTDKEASQNYTSYRVNSNRDVLDIPFVEIRNAILEAITEQFSIARDSLSLIAAKKLGFTRRGTNVDNTINSAIEQLLSQHIITEQDSNLKRAEN